MTSSDNRSTPRRRVAGERRRPHAAGSEPVVGQSAPDAAVAASPATPGADAPTAKVPVAKVPAKDPTTERASASRVHPSWMVAGLGLLVATTGLVTSLVIWRAAEDRRTLASNQAAAVSAAGAIIEKMLAYDYKSFDQHTTEVSALLTGGFKKEFVQAATDVVKPLAVQNQAVVLAKASEVSVMGTPDQDIVKILAFVDQTTTSAKLERPQIDQNRVILTMLQADGRWLVSKVEAF